MSTAVAGGAPYPVPRQSAAPSVRRQKLIPPATTYPSLPGRRRRHLVDGRRHVDSLEIGGADDFQILHVLRVIVEIVRDAWPLMHDVAGLHQGRLVLVHEAGPALGHDHDLEIAQMLV